MEHHDLQSFNVIMNSNISLSGAVDRNNLQYLINFDFLPYGFEYDMKFSFTSTLSGTLSNWNSSPAVSMTIIQIPELVNNVWIAGANSSCSSSPTLGVAHLWASSVSTILLNGYQLATLNDNPPIRLKKRPDTNILTVRLFQADGTTLHTRYRDNDVNYVLMLHFKQIKKSENIYG